MLGELAVGIILGLGIAWTMCIIICVFDSTIEDYRREGDRE